MTDLVTVKHEKTKATAQVPKGALEHWATKGWKPVDSKNATEGADSDSTTPKSRS